MEKDFSDLRAVSRQVAFVVDEIFEAVTPDSLRHQLSRQPLAFEQIALHAHDEHLLVLRAIEDADVPAPREAKRGAPEKVVIELLVRGRLERVHRAALRVDTRENVL